MPDTAMTLPIEGMTCASCAGRVERALAKLPGVAAAQVNLASEQASVTGAVPLPTLIAAVEKAGYAVPSEVTTLAIGGMTCASCVGRVERALSRVPGVLAVQVNLASEQARITAVHGTDPGLFEAAIARAGYEVKPREAEPVAKGWRPRRADIELGIAWLLTLPFIAAMLGMALGRDWAPGGWVQFALATPLQLYFGGRFWRSGWAALRSGAGSMDQLVAIGTTAAWALSVWLLLNHGMHLYFEAAAVVITFVLTGRFLEARAKRATGAAIEALLALRPRMARRLTEAGQEEEVPAAILAPGDRIVVRPGERIPADGVVEQGEAGVDESALTGESRAVEKGPGDMAATGTVALDGRLVIRATAVGGETRLARVAALVEAAQASRAPVQKLVDRVAAVFVPVVVAIAVVTFLGWLLAGQGVEQAILAAVAVLVIACPCALGLATPAAIMAGTGAAARAGILLRDAEAIERGGAITLVAFDKTGTLTEGRPRLVALHAAPGVSRAEALSAAAALQSGSEHPLARAVIEAAREDGLPPSAQPEGFRALPGRGVEGRIDGRRLLLGSPRLLAESGATAEGLLDAAREEGEAGRSLAWLIDPEAGRALALLSFEDSPRPGAAAAIAALQKAGVRTAMISGDMRAAAETAGKRLGIQDIAAEVLPADKAGRVVAWQAQAQRVAMVGDGVNDAPALATADLGIAMGSGTDAAIAAAPVTLLRPDPALVPAALAVARATLATIRRNLIWAFGFNVLGIPLAAFGELSPAIAGAAMAFSSVAVLTSALWLARWRPEPTGEHS
ncbi:heavy metal translocating P-type ATPase [Acetobacteraceae bacterium H6797]|nr:heavy metal translocating P-type ATPase [Acetobacteraceae bacterium H6797]